MEHPEYETLTKNFFPASSNQIYTELNNQATVARVVGNYLYVLWNYSVTSLPDYLNPSKFPTAASYLLSDLSSVSSFSPADLSWSFEFGPTFNIVARGNQISSVRNFGDGRIPTSLSDPLTLSNKKFLGAPSLTYSNDFKYLLWFANDAADSKTMYAGIVKVGDFGTLSNVTSVVLQSKNGAIAVQVPSLFVKSGSNYVSTIIRNEAIDSNDTFDPYVAQNDSKLQVWVFDGEKLKIKDSVCLKYTGICTDINRSANRVLVGERNVGAYGCVEKNDSQVLLYSLSKNFKLRLLDSKDYGWRCTEVCFAPNETLAVMGSRPIPNTPTNMNLLTIEKNKIRLLDTAILSQGAGAFEWTDNSNTVYGAGSLVSISEAPNLLKAELSSDC